VYSTRFLQRFQRRERSNFSYLWGAHTASIFGSQISVIAVPLLAIAKLDANSFELGLLTAAALIPYLAIGLVVGVWVDRLRKRPLLIAADLGRAACLIAIPVLVWLGWLSLWLLLAMVFVHGLLTVVFNVTDVSYLPSLVEKKDLPQANARLTLSTSVARVGGPAFAGGIVSLLSAPFALLVDGASYLISAGLLRRIRDRSEPPDASAHEPWRQAITQGARTLVRTPVLFALVSSAGMTSFFGMAFQTIFVLFLTERLDIGPAGVGAIYAIGGAGATLGTLCSAPLLKRFGIGPTILIAQSLFGVCGLIMPLSLLVPTGAVVVVAFAQFSQLAFNTMREVNGAALSQLCIPPEQLGRTQATSLVSIKALELIGSLGTGALALAIGVSETIVLLEIGMFLSVVPVLRSPVPGVRDIGRIEADLPATIAP
jgi:predicted MFS family arabinose efflux permease